MHNTKQIWKAVLMTVILALLPVAGQAAVVYQEDFESATLGSKELPANWSGFDHVTSATVESDFGIAVSTGILDTGKNRFLYSRGVNAPVSGSDHTHHIAYDHGGAGFTRGDNIRCEFKFWSGIPNGITGSWADDGAPKGNSNQNMMPGGPWHGRAVLTGNILFAAPQGILRYWDWNNDHIGCDETGDPWIPAPGSLSPEFHLAAEAAHNKATAMTVRVWLGDVDGLMFEWDSPVVDGSGAAPGVFYEEKDTRDLGSGGTETDLIVAFGTYAGACAYDDISVTNDAKGLLWSENFETQALGVDVTLPTDWTAVNQFGPDHDPGGTGVIQKSEYGIKNQDQAIYQRGTTLNSGSNHTPYISYDNAFNRGDSLRVTFTAIRGVANNVYGSWADDAQRGPEGLMTFNGPWHQLAMRANAMAGQPNIGSGVGPGTNEGIIRYWGKPGWGFDQPGDAWTPIAANQMSAGFTDAWFNSLSKDKAISIRAVLGDMSGARLGYKPPGAPEYINEIDNRGAASGPGVGDTATDLILAWATFASAIMIDDVLVETGALPATVTPTASPTVTSTPLPSPTPTSVGSRKVLLSENFEGVHKGTVSGTLPSGWYGHNHDDGAGNTSDFGVAPSHSTTAGFNFAPGPNPFGADTRNHFGYVRGTTVVSGAIHTNYYRVDGTFTRGDNLCCEFDVWQGLTSGGRGSWADAGPPLGGTNHLGIYGPWQTQPGIDAADAGTSGALLFTGTGPGCEACIRYWSFGGAGAIGFDQPGDAWVPAAANILSAGWHNAMKVAVNSGTACTIRVYLGDSTGASIEWKSPIIDAGNGVDVYGPFEFDNRGLPADTNAPAVGSAAEVIFFLTTYASELAFDNIVIQNDTKGILFSENFDSTEPGVNVTPAGMSAINEVNGADTSEYGVGAEDHFMYQRGMGPGSSDQGFYHVGYDGPVQFDRGDNLNVEFKWWSGVYNNVRGSWADHAAATGSMTNVAIFGPWVTPTAVTDARNDVTNAILFNGVEAMLRYYDLTNGNIGFHQVGDPWPVHNRMSLAFHEAANAGVNKDKAVCIRVWLGNTTGARCEWKVGGAGGSTVEYDNRGDAAGTGVSDTATDIRIVFKTFAGANAIDDVIVSTDSGVGIDDWSQY